jgi:putative sugar O-methyltransferase
MFEKLRRKLQDAIAHPELALYGTRLRLLRRFGKREFIAREGERSRSEAGLYVAFVQKAVRNYGAFADFKRHPSYRSVLEHTTQEHGARYLDIVRQDSPHIVDLIDRIKVNDSVGNPFLFEYPGIGRISPSTLRYAKVASDLHRHFDGDLGHKIAEIGVGYGGQMFVNDCVFKIGEYHLFDLPPVLQLASKFLESFVLAGSYKVSTLNQHTGGDVYDLAISNYAFSEFPESLQRAYVAKILSKARRGYLTMNTGLDRTSNKLSLSDLRNLLPPFEVFEERPKTAATNYVIVWGHKAATSPQLA